MSLDLISKSDFVGFLNIQFSETQDVFSIYADQLEQKVLTDLFGAAMYKDMLDNPTNPSYEYLVDTYLKQMQKGFFYYYFLLDRESYSSTLGEFSSEAENASRNPKSRNDKTISAYNDALDLYWECHDYINDNIGDYPLYTKTKPKANLNVFGVGRVFVTDATYPYDHGDWFIRGYRR